MHAPESTGWLRPAAVAVLSVVLRGDAEAQRLPLTPCQIPSLSGDVRCGTLEVYENRARRAGRRIPIHVIVARATGSARAADPLFLFAGGPGQAASEMGGFAASAFGPTRVERDLVFVDARGTGRSRRLDCRLYQTPRSLFGDFYPVDVVRHCADSLASFADLTQYTTDNIAADIDQLRAALGYGSISIYGTSYGTRLALAFLRRYPTRVRALILKSVAPPDMAMPMTYARDAERALALLFRDCNRDEACARAFPALEHEFRALMERADRGELRAAIPEQPADTVSISRDALSTAVMGMLQAAPVRAAIPDIIHRAHQGSLAPLAQAIAQYRRGLDGGSIAIGMHLSVTCSEDNWRVDTVRAAREDSGTFLQDARVRAQSAACRVWPRARVPDSYFRPVRSSVPVLVVSGDLDPNTPPRLAEQVLGTLPRGRHVILPTVAHGFTGVAQCGAGFMKQFLENPALQRLDLGCVASSTIPAFLVP
jgi:pimeloyl-ACP methyl ester carboxylesterase